MKIEIRSQLSPLNLMSQGLAIQGGRVLTEEEAAKATPVFPHPDTITSPDKLADAEESTGLQVRVKNGNPYFFKKG